MIERTDHLGHVDPRAVIDISRRPTADFDTVKEMKKKSHGVGHVELEVVVEVSTNKEEALDDGDLAVELDRVVEKSHQLQRSEVGVARTNWSGSSIRAEITSTPRMVTRTRRLVARSRMLFSMS